jgi:flagellar hook protein FlgE
MGYGIGLAGLTTTSQAIDVVSNNIANAQTVGYKNAQFVFADMYFKANDAQAKDRAGMGSQQQAIRRDQSGGSVTATQNPLDLAITGPGFFMLAKNADDGGVPDETLGKFEYSRNGQFGTDNKNRMVNPSGMLVVGYPAASDGTITAGTKSVLTLDQTPLPSQPTENSEVALNLDTRNSKIDYAFDPTDSKTYSQGTSQTIYDQNGIGHILALYYKRISSQPLTLTKEDSGGYSYNPTQPLPDITDTDLTAGTHYDAATNRLFNEQMPVIASTYKGENKKYVTTSGVRTFNDTDYDVNTQPVTIMGAVKTLTGGNDGELDSTYDLRLIDGTHVPITQTSATTASTITYTATVDRFEVYATIDGNKVGHDPAAGADGDVDFVQLSDTTYSGEQQMSIGTMAFMGGKNIDTLQLGSDGQPENDANTSFYLNALSSGIEGDYGRTDDDGIMQFTLSSDDMSALIAPGQTYANSQDGHTVSNLSSYAIDSEGKLIATYDNGETLVKGQIALALFSNPDGLMPNGSNTFTATDASGREPIFSAPGSGLLGQVRSKALESSNVDLTAQLVQLMVLQRQYSATSQALKLQASTLIDDAINMGR